MGVYFRLSMYVSEREDVEESWIPGTPTDEYGRYFASGAFSTGQRFETIPKLLLTPIVVYGEPFDFTFDPNGTPVVRNKLARIIEEIDPEAVQRIPVTIVGGKFSGFEILNIIRILECIDFERSGKIIRDDGLIDPRQQGRIKHISKPKIKSDLYPKYHIFRPREWPIPIVVSSHLKEILEVHKFTGLSFTEL